MNFIAITNCQDPAKGQKFLEMAGGNLDVILTSKQSPYFSKSEKTDWEARPQVSLLLRFGSGALGLAPFDSPSVAKTLPNQSVYSQILEDTPIRKNS